MKLNKVKGNCYYTDFEKERDRPTLGYIKGTKYSIMIDAGTSKNHTDEYFRLIKEEGLDKPTMTFITHWHWDHTFGMDSLNTINVVLDKTSTKLREMMSWKWTDEAMKDRLHNKLDIEFADEHIRKEYDDLSNIKVVDGDIVFSENFYIDLGDQIVDVMHVDSPHSEDSVILYARNDKVLYVGDAVSVDYYNDNYLDKDKMKKLKEVFDSIDFETCITGHNEPVAKDHLVSVMERLSE